MPRALRRGWLRWALVQTGLKVVVLEAAGYFNESDFNQLELWGYQNLEPPVMCFRLIDVLSTQGKRWTALWIVTLF